MAPVPGVDPLFTDEDFEELVDYLAWKDSLCPRCGEPKHLSFAPEHQWAYRADVLSCHSCAAMSMALSKVDGEPSALFAVIKKRPG